MSMNIDNSVFYFEGHEYMTFLMSQTLLLKSLAQLNSLLARFLD